MEKERKQLYENAQTQLKSIELLAQTITLMAKRDENDVTLIPRNIELIDNIIVTFENLRNGLIEILNELEIDVNENTLKN